MEYEIQLGDRKTFLREQPIRILERILGIEREYTQTNYNSRHSTGAYNDNMFRGGHGGTMIQPPRSYNQREHSRGPDN